MDKAIIDDIKLEYEVAGLGEPVVFIHGALIADSFRPLLTESALVKHYRLITYHRRGYMGSSRGHAPISIAQQAADCRALLHYLEIQRAHIVGHSLGGCIAIQLTLDNPNLVQSLALLEPGLMGESTGPAYREALLKGQQRFREGFREQVIDDSLRSRFGIGYRSKLDQVLPDAFEQAVDAAAISFETELPGLLDWRFGEAEAKQITQPVLAVLGSESNALWSRFGETHRMLLEWLLHIHEFILPGAAHGLQIWNPGGMAEALSNFFTQHPIQHQM
jgi:pimeloyl-ACP methyl ester carboxylesterase